MSEHSHNSLHGDDLPEAESTTYGEGDHSSAPDSAQAILGTSEAIPAPASPEEAATGALPADVLQQLNGELPRGYIPIEAALAKMRARREERAKLIAAGELPPDHYTQEEVDEWLRERHREKVRAYWSSERRKALGQHMRQRWSDPEKAERMRSARWDGDVFDKETGEMVPAREHHSRVMRRQAEHIRAKQAATRLRNQSDPAWRERHNAKILANRERKRLALEAKQRQAAEEESPS